MRVHLVGGHPAAASEPDLLFQHLTHLGRQDAPVEQPPHTAAVAVCHTQTHQFSLILRLENEQSIHGVTILYHAQLSVEFGGVYTCPIGVGRAGAGPFSSSSLATISSICSVTSYHVSSKPCHATSQLYEDIDGRDTDPYELIREHRRLGSLYNDSPAAQQMVCMTAAARIFAPTAHGTVSGPVSYRTHDKLRRPPSLARATFSYFPYLLV